MNETKVSSRHHKTTRLFGLLKSYLWPLLDVMSLLFLLFLFTLPVELEPYIEVHLTQFLTHYIIIAALLVLVLSRAYGWSAPFYPEEALILALLWMLLSATQSHTLVFCSGEHHPMMAPHMSESVDMIHATDHYHERLIHCDRDVFNNLYSLLCLLLPLFAYGSDLRPYWLGAICRAITVLLLLVVVLLPSSCNRIGWMTLVEIMLKLVLYKILDFFNCYRRVTEKLLLMTYSTAIDTLVPRLTPKHYVYVEPGRTRSRPRHTDTEPTASEVYARFLHLTKFIVEHELITQGPRRSNNYHHTSDELFGQDAPVRREKSIVSSLESHCMLMLELNDVADTYYRETSLLHLFSWKQRKYGESMAIILDLARTLWVLFICSYFLPLALIQLIYTLWYIYHDSYELRESNKITKVMLTYTSETGQI